MQPWLGREECLRELGVPINQKAMATRTDALELLKIHSS